MTTIYWVLLWPRFTGRHFTFTHLTPQQPYYPQFGRDWFKRFGKLIKASTIDEEPKFICRSISIPRLFTITLTCLLHTLILHSHICQIRCIALSPHPSLRNSFSHHFLLAHFLSNVYYVTGANIVVDGVSYLLNIPENLGWSSSKSHTMLRALYMHYFI